MNRRDWRSMTTVFCIAVDTTTPQGFDRERTVDHGTGTSDLCTTSPARGHRSRRLSRQSWSVSPLRPSWPVSFALSSLPFDSPGLLHAIFGSKANLISIDFEPTGDFETEAAAVLRDPLFFALDVDHEHVAGLIDDASADMLLARVGRVDDLHPQPDQLVLPEVGHYVFSPDGAAFAGAAFPGTAAPPASSSSRMIVRMRAMFFRSARIFPGFGGAPPIAATPRSCISSSRSSVSFFAIVSASIARISFVRSNGITSRRLLPFPRRRRRPARRPAWRPSSDASSSPCAS